MWPWTYLSGYKSESTFWTDLLAGFHLGGWTLSQGLWWLFSRWLFADGLYPNRQLSTSSSWFKPAVEIDQSNMVKTFVLKTLHPAKHCIASTSHIWRQIFDVITISVTSSLLLCDGSNLFLLARTNKNLLISWYSTYSTIPQLHHQFSDVRWNIWLCYHSRPCILSILDILYLWISFISASHLILKQRQIWSKLFVFFAFHTNPDLP